MENPTKKSKVLSWTERMRMSQQKSLEIHYRELKELEYTLKYILEKEQQQQYEESNIAQIIAEYQRLIKNKKNMIYIIKTY